MLERLPKQNATAKTPRTKPRNAGFTIVEVAIASTILVVALCSCFGVLQMSFKLLDNARTSTLAAQIMQSEIERLRLLNWSDLSSLSTTTPTPINVSAVYSGDSNMAKRFAATRHITPTAGRETTMMDIQISVTWTGTNGATYVRSFKTKYSKNGLYDYFYTARPAA